MLEVWKDAPKTQHEERPWGIFTKFSTMHSGITLKEIVVKPMQRLSLQKHLRRDELWIFLSPDMIVDTIAPNGAKETRNPAPVTEGALPRIYIPRNWWHRLTNVGDKTGHLLEISFGEFDEDDIIRLEDDFGRVKTSDKTEK
ncbi:mannose-6-phosphate isomerase [Patescibacteria group bacterium]|nr:MAG: mannose-6-phosphate isomerase [Patescibacteria group bacterium]